ncbi:MAG: (Fe-S)-binding protein [Bacteroidales bacterium]|nr:(Fe-S)-binding protein [Bacteroidales bacterium]
MSEISSNNIVNLFIPCQMDMFQPNTAQSVKNVLEKLGVRCQYDSEQTCCGRRFYLQGEIEYAKSLSIQLVDNFGTKTPVVIPDCGCAGFMKQYLRQLLENSHSSTERANFVQLVYEMCDFIVNVKHVESLGNKFHHRVYYFKSCSARNLYPDNDAPEILLRNTEGLELLISENQPICCGANGRFPLMNPNAAEVMTGEVIRQAYDMGAEFITSTDIHCLQQLDAYKEAHDVGVEIIHVADILNGEKDKEIL